MATSKSKGSRESVKPKTGQKSTPSESLVTPRQQPQPGWGKRASTTPAPLGESAHKTGSGSDPGSVEAFLRFWYVFEMLATPRRSRAGRNLASGIHSESRPSDFVALLMRRFSARSLHRARPSLGARRTELQVAEDEGQTTALPRRKRTALELASDVLENPGSWLRQPNSQLGDRPPIELIGTDEEFKVYNLLNAVDQGLF